MKVKKIIIPLLILLMPFVTFAASLQNPLGNIQDPETLAIRIIQVFLGFVSLIGLAMFLLGGFQFLTSGGNAEKVKKAKGTLVWAALGILTIVGSYTILTFVFQIILKK